MGGHGAEGGHGGARGRGGAQGGHGRSVGGRGGGRKEPRAPPAPGGLLAQPTLTPYNPRSVPALPALVKEPQTVEGAGAAVGAFPGAESSTAAGTPGGREPPTQRGSPRHRCTGLPGEVAGPMLGRLVPLESLGTSRTPRPALREQCPVPLPPPPFRASLRLPPRILLGAGGCIPCCSQCNKIPGAARDTCHSLLYCHSTYKVGR